MEIMIICRDHTRGNEDKVLHVLDKVQSFGFVLTRYRLKMGILEGKFDGAISSLYTIPDVEKVVTSA